MNTWKLTLLEKIEDAILRSKGGYDTREEIDILVKAMPTDYDVLKVYAAWNTWANDRNDRYLAKLLFEVLKLRTIEKKGEIE